MPSDFDPSRIPFVGGNHTPGRGGQSIDTIVIHNTGGDSMSRTIGWFQKQGSAASAHYVIGTDGTIEQVVRDADTAWHTLHENKHSIGIELVNIGADPGNFYPGNVDYPPYTEEQYQSLTNLVAHLAYKYNIPLDNIKGHDAFPLGPKRYGEPGPSFDWNRLSNGVKEQLQEKLTEELQQILNDSEGEFDANLLEKVRNFVVDHAQAIENIGCTDVLNGVLEDAEKNNGAGLRSGLEDVSGSGFKPPVQPSSSPAVPILPDRDPEESGVWDPDGGDDVEENPDGSVSELDPARNDDSPSHLANLDLQGAVGHLPDEGQYESLPYITSDGDDDGIIPMPIAEPSEPVEFVPLSSNVTFVAALSNTSDSDDGVIPSAALDDSEDSAPEEAPDSATIPDDGQFGLPRFSPSQAPADLDAARSVRYVAKDGSIREMNLPSRQDAVAMLQGKIGDEDANSSGEDNDPTPPSARTSLFGSDPFGVFGSYDGIDEGPPSPPEPAPDMLEPIAGFQPNRFGSDDFGMSPPSFEPPKTDLIDPIEPISPPMHIEPPPLPPPLPPEPDPPMTMEHDKPDIPSFRPSEPPMDDFTPAAPMEAPGMEGEGGGEEMFA